jgi:hypothetical protein
MRKAALALLLPCSIGAQTLDNGTVDVYFQPVTAQGRAEGCSLVFTSLERDFQYLQGQQVVLNGSIAIRVIDGNDLMFTGKLGTRPFVGGSPGKWDAPAHFYFATRNGTTAGHAVIADSDTEGYKLLIGRVSNDNVMKLLKEMGETQTFTVGFNRRPGGQDVHSSIRMNVALKKDDRGNARQVLNDETPAQFFDCLARLASDLQRRLRK